MKKTLTVDVFKEFIEKISIVKKCKLEKNNEAVIELDDGNKGTVLLAVADEGYPKQVLDIIANIDSDLEDMILWQKNSRMFLISQLSKK